MALTMSHRAVGEVSSQSIRWKFSEPSTNFLNKLWIIFQAESQHMRTRLPCVMYWRRTGMEGQSVDEHTAHLLAGVIKSLWQSCRDGFLIGRWLQLLQKDVQRQIYDLCTSLLVACWNSGKKTVLPMTSSAHYTDGRGRSRCPVQLGAAVLLSRKVFCFF